MNSDISGWGPKTFDHLTFILSNFVIKTNVKQKIQILLAKGFRISKKQLMPLQAFDTIQILLFRHFKTLNIRFTGVNSRN